MMIAVDIDAVLADFLSKFLEYRNYIYHTNYVRDDFYTYIWAEVFGESKEQMYAILSDFFESGYVDQIKPMPGAVAGIGALEKQGHEVYVVTSRPRMIKDLTLRWLRKNFGNVFKAVFFSNQPAYGSFGPTKGEICRQIRAKVFIDDQLSYCRECLEEGRRVFLFDNPWNKDLDVPSGVIRAYSWPEIIENIKNYK